MEKFAVDLDKVLDEFEFSEDCAEQTAPNGKQNNECVFTPGAPIVTKGGISLQEGIQTYPVADSVNVPEPIVQLDSVYHGMLHNERELKRLMNECNPEEHSNKSLTSYTSKINDDRRSSTFKLNVSGVFSCLNEYINTGSMAIDVGNTDANGILMVDEKKTLHLEEKDSPACSNVKGISALSPTSCNDVNSNNFNDNNLNSHPALCSVYPKSCDHEYPNNVSASKEVIYNNPVFRSKNENFSETGMYIKYEEPTLSKLSDSQNRHEENGEEDLQTSATNSPMQPNLKLDSKDDEKLNTVEVPDLSDECVSENASPQENCDLYFSNINNDDHGTSRTLPDDDHCPGSVLKEDHKDRSSLSSQIDTQYSLVKDVPDGEVSVHTKQKALDMNNVQVGDKTEITVTFKSQDEYDKEFLASYLEVLAIEDEDCEILRKSRVREGISYCDTLRSGQVDGSEKEGQNSASTQATSVTPASNISVSNNRAINTEPSSAASISSPCSTSAVTTSASTTIIESVCTISVTTIPISGNTSACSASAYVASAVSLDTCNNISSHPTVTTNCTTTVTTTTTSPAKPCTSPSGLTHGITFPAITTATSRDADSPPTVLGANTTSVIDISQESFKEYINNGNIITVLKENIDNDLESCKNAASQTVSQSIEGRESSTEDESDIGVPAYGEFTDGSLVDMERTDNKNCISFDESDVQNCNSLATNILDNRKVAANVNNVVSIECQQMKRNISDDNSSDSISQHIMASGSVNEAVQVSQVISDELNDDLNLSCGYERAENSVSEENRMCSSFNSIRTRERTQDGSKENSGSGSYDGMTTEKETNSPEDQNFILPNEGLDSTENSASPETSSIEIAESPLPSPGDTTSEFAEQSKLGKVPPLWVPDGHAPACMLCSCRFTVLKRRHHCRACGKVFCSKCCYLKLRLPYMNGTEVRVCQLCHDILARETELTSSLEESSSNQLPSDAQNRSVPLGRQPNPNNPMEYCSTIPPLEQAASSQPLPVPSVLVPVGVLKREGCSRLKSDVSKQVMFSDGIRPGGDLTELDDFPETRVPYRQSDLMVKHMTNVSGGFTPGGSLPSSRPSRPFEPKTKSYIPAQGLPPLAVMSKSELKLEEIDDINALMSSIRCEMDLPVVFALNKNLFVQVKILNLDCCVHRVCWCFSTVGMSCVGQDEIVIVLECLSEENTVPRDIFCHLNVIYHEASRGNLVNEMGHTIIKGTSFLNSSEHGGFIYIRPSFQCLHKLILPSAPYLVGILIHRWEIPWAKVFPIRLMLRLGAEFRYYPCMLVSVQLREPVYCEIGHTIMNLLADFRNLSYTLPSIRGMVIHMEDRHTSILLPKNRYDQVTRALNNSNDHVLALAANFSLMADSHLVCIQSQGDSYHTQAINIHNKPRKVTGASFVVFNGALKISSNLTAKSTIVEDGLMVQITPDMIQELRSSLHKMKDFTVHCGPNNSSVPDETVDIRWVDDDHNFNVGVQSVIDGLALDGVPSIRVHNSHDYMGKTRFIRWTEVFIIQSGDSPESPVGASDPIDISRVSENLANATCAALCDFLDLLAQGGFTRIAVRANIHQENVGYTVGGHGETLPPIYMKTLDSALVPVLHHAASAVPESPPVCLELLFHIMLQ